MFITLEGIEGAGKTSQLKNIIAFLGAKGYECLTTREPGGTAIGAKIRGILLDPANNDLNATTELLLYVADRVQHIETVIKPQLATGGVVLCDRFFDATMVYQGYARGLDKAMILNLHRLACNDLQPDLTLLFDLDPEVGLARAWRQINNGGRTGTESRFEQEKLAFHRMVRDGYLAMARKDPERYRTIDAGKDQNEVKKAICNVLDSFLAGS